MPHFDTPSLDTVAAEGWPTANLPLRAGKGWPYEGGVREPMIVVAPGVTKPGTTCDSPVISTDFYPTLLQLAGLPAKPEQHLDGVSFVPLLQGGTMQRGKPLFWHYPHYANQGGAPNGVIRDGDWKLIEWYEDGALELYNIPQDLSEKTNLAAQQPGRVKELHAKLIAWRKEVGALMPTLNPAFDPNAKPAKGAPKNGKKDKAFHGSTLVYPREALNKATFADFGVGRGRWPLALATHRARALRFAGPGRRAAVILAAGSSPGGCRRPSLHAAARTRAPITTFANLKSV